MPENPFQTLFQRRQWYPIPMTNDQLGELLNAVAWAHRTEGYGLLSKPTGGNCRQPITGKLVSRDILMLSSGAIFDCLIDAEGDAIPSWTSKGTIDPGRWVRPIDPGWVSLPPPEPPAPPSPVTVPYPGDWVGHEIGVALFADYAEAGQAPNTGMGVWLLRIAWDMANMPYLSAAESIKKHRAEWRRALGLL